MIMVDERIRLGEWEFSDRLRAEKDPVKSQSQEEAIKEIKEATRVHLLMLSEDGAEIPQASSLQVTN